MNRWLFGETVISWMIVWVKMHNYREIYRAEELPVFQNRMYSSREEARHCVKGDVVLVQDLETGLIFNNAFRPELMQYDENYQNEQAVSLIFKNHLSEVLKICDQAFSRPVAY